MKKAAHQTSSSLKTVYLYLFIVFICIVISLILKGIFIIQQSKFDPAHHFTLAVTQHNQVKEIISFNPQTPAVWGLIITNNIAYMDLVKKYGITTDGYIQVDNATFSKSDIISFLWSSIAHTELWKSNITLFDKFRLLLLAKNVTTNNKTIEDITLSDQNPSVDLTVINALTDQDIANENISIQIINATEIPGFGQRLGQVLSNLGANVVDVSTAQRIQKKSSLAYFGNESYTLNRIQKLLNLPTTTLSRQGIADIVITIGTDKKNTTEF
jgi:hypothetical protein